MFTLKQCYQAEELMQIYNIPDSKAITGAQLQTMSPALLQQQVSGACAETHEEADRPSSAEGKSALL